ncbi:HVO_0234 family beta-propeller protein [Natronosalvus rutilus]|uniref:HVO-0234-like beta-propeller domain-containing protein n=1 Tax=Natronosalvus rutilus TaxID=2953753 RepID=A0A9E7NBP8_9EURY|nr:hypothetical protein [Natronosalvus rutilus]UTF54441.1 hypothetical protein NGM29_03950 [Natronosalvus rutilus]
MVSIDEKRVYGAREGATAAYVAAEMGVVRVLISGDAVGEFSLLERCTAHDLAAGVGWLAVATDEDVLVSDLSSESEEHAFVRTDFGPAVAVGIRDGTLLAADAAGRAGTLGLETLAADDWHDLAFPDAKAPEQPTVRAADGDLLATDAGVYRRSGTRLVHAGLSAVRDVSAAGVPLAATADGLYRLGNGWMRDLEGPFDRVAADPLSDPGSLGRAHALGDAVYEHGTGGADPETASENGWRRLEALDTDLVDVAYGDGIYAVTEDGTVLVADPGRGPGTESRWRPHPIGVRGVAAMVVPLERA